MLKRFLLIAVLLLIVVPLLNTNSVGSVPVTEPVYQRNVPDGSP